MNQDCVFKAPGLIHSRPEMHQCWDTWGDSSPTRNESTLGFRPEKNQHCAFKTTGLVHFWPEMIRRRTYSTPGRAYEDSWSDSFSDLNFVWLKYCFFLLLRLEKSVLISISILNRAFAWNHRAQGFPHTWTDSFRHLLRHLDWFIHLRPWNPQQYCDYEYH